MLKKGQASLEYLLVISAAVIVTAIVLYATMDTGPVGTQAAGMGLASAECGAFDPSECNSKTVVLSGTTYACRLDNANHCSSSTVGCTFSLNPATIGADDSMYIENVVTFGFSGTPSFAGLSDVHCSDGANPSGTLSCSGTQCTGDLSCGTYAPVGTYTIELSLQDDGVNVPCQVQFLEVK